MVDVLKRRTFARGIRTFFPLAITGLVLLYNCRSFAQPQSNTTKEAATLPQFEVVSVKKTERIGIKGVGNRPGGKVEATICSVQDLIIAAYGIQRTQIVGAQEWTGNEWYNVIGIPPEDSPVRKLEPPSRNTPLHEEQRKMLQAVLRDRFQLKVHYEKRILPAYLLVQGNNSLKLKKAQADDKMPPWAGGLRGGMIEGDGIAGQNISMDLLARQLSTYIARTVLNRTGLEGSFYFNYSYHGAEIHSEEDYISSIFSSLEGIGLKIKASKESIDVLVIDSVERPTTN